MTQIDNTMNIKTTRTDISSKATPHQSGKTSDETSRTADASASTSPRGDSITLTEAAGAIVKLQESLSSVPDIDHQRVAEIKASIADGSYQVNPEQIVESLLNMEQELLQ